MVSQNRWTYLALPVGPDSTRWNLCVHWKYGLHSRFNRQVIRSMKHKHHILPTHAGGTDDPTNIVYLSILEHAEAHRVLWEQHKRKGDRLAWLALSGQIDKEEIQKEKTALGVAATIARQTGRKQSAETIEKRAKKLRGKKRTAATRLLSSEVMLGTTRSARNWIITTPQGVEMTIHNLEVFCKENGLWGSAMTLVSQGKRSHHKQWKCKKVTS